MSQIWQTLHIIDKLFTKTFWKNTKKKKNTNIPRVDNEIFFLQTGIVN